VSTSFFAAEPVTPTTRQPWMRASCPTTLPVAPAAADTSTVSSAAGRPTSNSPK
jgi:hypothetical protein